MANILVDHIRQQRRGLRETERFTTDFLIRTRRWFLVWCVVGSRRSETQEDPSHEIEGVWSGGGHGCWNLVGGRGDERTEWKDNGAIPALWLNTRSYKFRRLAGRVKWHSKQDNGATKKDAHGQMTSCDRGQSPTPRARDKEIRKRARRGPSWLERRWSLPCIGEGRETCR